MQFIEFKVYICIQHGVSEYERQLFYGIYKIAGFRGVKGYIAIIVQILLARAA